jgi:hypothetical protein
MSDLRAVGSAIEQRQAAPAAATPIQREVWLAHLERARWDAQPRYEAAADRDAAGGEERLPADADMRSPVAAAARQDDASGEQAVCGDAALEPARHSTAELLLARAAGAAGLGAPPAMNGSVPPVPTMPMHDDETAPVHVQADAELPGEPAADAWQSRSVHVFVGDEATTVWVRDARLRSEDGARLLEQLRPLLGDGSAQTPVQLNVNGQRVSGPHGR